MKLASQKTNPTWHKNTAIRNRNIPKGLCNGVNDQGINPHTGPVSRMINMINATALDNLKPHELGILSSLVRLESYQSFSTEDRFVSIFLGNKAVRRICPHICNPELVRNRLPEVTTVSQSTTNLPSRFNAKAKAPSSLQYNLSSNPPLASKAFLVQNIKAPPENPTNFAKRITNGDKKEISRI